MKILAVSNLYPPHVLGGYEILCGQVCNFLCQKGHEVSVLTSGWHADDPDPSDRDKVVDSAADEEGSEVSGGRKPAVYRELKLYHDFPEAAGFERKARAKTASCNRAVTAECIKRTEPDVIFIWSLLRLTPGPARAAEAYDVPVCCSFNDENIAGFVRHSFSLHPRRLYHWFMDRFITPEITLADIRFPHMVCISEVTKRNLIRKGVPAEDAKVIYQGIPIERFPVRKEEAGFLHQPVRFLYAGQVHHYKGVHVLIEALTQLKQDGSADGEGKIPDFTLTIAGDGEPEYLKQLADAAENGGIRVNWKGKTAYDAMPKIYRSHDIFVFPSIWEEPFGLTHLEAMASGLPVVSTDNGGQRVFLRDRENALVCGPDDPAGLAEALRVLLSDDELRRCIAAEGRKTIEKDFTFSRYAEEIETELIRLSAEN